MNESDILVEEFENAIRSFDRDKIIRRAAELDNSVNDTYFYRKVNETIQVIDKAILILKTNGSLVSRNQSMVLENYLLNKIWADIYNTASKSSGVSNLSLSVYKNSEASGNDRSNVAPILETLCELTQDLSNVSSYSEFIQILISKQPAFCNIDIKYKD